MVNGMELFTYLHETGYLWMQVLDVRIIFLFCEGWNVPILSGYESLQDGDFEDSQVVLYSGSVISNEVGSEDRVYFWKGRWCIYEISLNQDLLLIFL